MASSTVTPKDRNTTSFGQDFVAQLSLKETVDNESTVSLEGAIGTLAWPLLSGFCSYFARKATGWFKSGWIGKIKEVNKK